MNDPSQAQQAFVSAGANLGDRAATLAGAVKRLASWPGVAVLECSSVYESIAVGEITQPPFLNLVVGLETRRTPEALLSVLLEIEREFGRVRVERWGPRTLDLDLLLFGEVRCRTPGLDLPHPRMLERAFVTVPLRELLERPSFLLPEWERWRERLRSIKNTEGIELFSRKLGGERS